MLESYCAAKGWRAEVIKDLGSGMNYRKPGLNKLLEMILRKQMRRLVITHKDRLLRFGSELVFALCAHQQIEIVIIHKGEQPTFEEELAKDVLEIITVFSARLYGSRSKKNRDLIEAMKKAAERFFAYGNIRDGSGMNELYTALVIAFVCAGIGFVGYVIGVVAQASEFDISNVGSEE